MGLCVFLCSFWLTILPAFSHEMNTAYLELREGADESVSVLIRVPEFGTPFSVAFPAVGRRLSEPVERSMDGGIVQTWRMDMPGGLANQTIGIEGLALSDLLARVQLADGSEQMFRLTPLEESFTIEAAASQLSVAGTYFMLGLDHILEGIDHLLFVLALMILIVFPASVGPSLEGQRPRCPKIGKGTDNGDVVPPERAGGIANWKKLTGAITTFTIAHSITLALASLGFVHVPGPPVEAIIALSIVFVACEILHSRQGRPGITEKSPWLVTLTFGLLHGLGFAGALSEIGLPQHAIPMALLFFNVGVEAGQLLFIFVVLCILGIVRLVKLPMPRWFRWIPPYAIGSIAMFWVIERVAAF